MKTLASLTAVLAFAIAGSASAQEARIVFGDLDMSNPVGANTFDYRVGFAAKSMCREARRPGSNISDRSACRAAVQAEALRLLPRQVQVDYARARGIVVL